jgi:hypothetical protein
LGRTVLGTGRGEYKMGVVHWRVGTQATEIRLDPSKDKTQKANLLMKQMFFLHCWPICRLDSWPSAGKLQRKNVKNKYYRVACFKFSITDLRTKCGAPPETSETNPPYLAY